MERIRNCLKLKRGKISEDEQKFYRKDAAPFGEFTKYTWRITSLAHIYKIFDNKTLFLEPTRYFTHESDGSFKYFPIINNYFTPQTAPSIQLIKPQEYKTVLKIGNPDSACTANASNATPDNRLGPNTINNILVIEWVPNILPMTEIGELRLKFEFDHYCNGQLTEQPRLIFTSKNKQQAIAPRPPLLPQNKFSFSIPSNNENILSIPITTANNNSGNGDSIGNNDNITIFTF